MAQSVAGEVAGSTHLRDAGEELRGEGGGAGDVHAGLYHQGLELAAAAAAPWRSGTRVWCVG
jgi:hypothetical protein